MAYCLALGWLGLAGLPLRGADIAPFVLPWDDATPGLTDLSRLNRAIGPNDRVGASSNGHFVVQGRRVRFLGVNFAGDSPFMPTNKAAAVAARLAKFGFNNVRFHHMDAPWATGGGILRYTTTSSREFNPQQLQRLHFLVARLKDRGIYANINLLVGREYRSGDGLGPEITSMDWKDQHIVGYFDDTALNLHREYATRLLTPVNPFTGMSLAADPAVSFVEIINENGIIQKWYDGGLDRLPSRYANRLQGRWNDWLVNRYASDARLQAAWAPINQPLQANLLRNGAFSNSVTGWTLERHEGAVATVTRTTDFNGGPSARIAVTRPGSAGWHVQFNQPGLSVTQAQIYTLTFSAKASQAIDLDVALMQAHDPWQAVGFTEAVPLTTQWQTFTRTIIVALPSSSPTPLEPNARVNFGGMGTSTATVWLADVRLQKGGQLGTLPSGATLANRTIPNVRREGDGYTGTANARRDWLAFLRDLEHRYYDTMVGHVRTNCGYPGLIFGTIMANSPATVQSRMDVIDGHAYWQHPEFPGTPWDPVNWFVRNISMVNTTNDGNTIAGLARQRIRGKPFTVTEYQHSSPNHYGAEGPLLLAAYGALQDWDGLWLFDYGPGNDSVGMGRFRGFFDIAQHPTKMANVPIAANLFRRGHVRPAPHEVVMALTPDRELELLASGAGAWSVFGSGQLGVPGAWAFSTRLSTDVGPQAQGFTQPPDVAPPTARTPELRWAQFGPGQGYVTVNTTHSKAVVGFIAERDIALGRVTIRCSPQRLPWASAALTLNRGTSFTNGTSLLVVSGWCENTGQRWKDARQESVGNQWGTAPTLIETVPFRLTMPVPSHRVQAWALDERGQRKSPVSVVAGASPDTSLITNAPGVATLWYEIEVVHERTTSFEDWRQTHFSESDLFDSDWSGPMAQPAGDGVPNMIKYALGIDPTTTTSSRSWVQPVLYGQAPNWRGGLQYTRAKDRPDLRFRPQVSANLSQWTDVSEPEAIVERLDLGDTEQITVLDSQPIPASGPRFMRLVVELIEPANPL